MTISEISGTAQEIFGAYVTDYYAKELFRFNLGAWSNSESLYDLSNNSQSLRMAISSYVPQINAALELKKIAENPMTSIVTGLKGGTSHESVVTNKQSNETVSGDLTRIVGDRAQDERVFPDGYIGDSDMAYKRAQTFQPSSTDKDTTNNSTEISGTDTETKDGKNDENTQTNYTDNVLRGKFLFEYPPQLSAVIAKCVFSLVANKYTGEL